jgi:hypothetical protein
MVESWVSMVTARVMRACVSSRSVYKISRKMEGIKAQLLSSPPRWTIT